MVHSLPYKFTYDSDRKNIFKQNLLNNEDIKSLADTLTKVEFGKFDIDYCITKVNEILITAAKKSFPFKKFTNRTKRRRPNKNCWYTRDCKSLRTVLRQHSRDLSRKPFSRKNLDLFVKARSAYKKTCQKAEKEYRKTLTKQLIDVGKKDPRTFWNIINRINKWGKEQSDPSEKISPERWNKHFTKLLDGANDKEIALVEAGNTFEPILDSRITTKEILETLAEMKSGKAPGPDGILIEYLKLFGETYVDITHKLVSKIFSEHIYPSKWNTNFLKPIFKKGNTDDPGNFRGLAIGPAFAKLYSHILLKRLSMFIDEKKLLSPNQVGFVKGKTTSDHIFLIQALIEKIVKKGKGKMFVAFIDFKKAYDTVNRNLLLNRLKQIGINGLFLKNIGAMYDKTKYSIKLNNGHLRPLHSNLGLKQGCPLSPILFNLYIDDIDTVFQDGCDPVEIQGEKLSHLLYADDLVIISRSEEGLQNALNKLHGFSLLKQLTINISKNKTLVFNTAGRFIKKTFSINGTYLDPVQNFCYLGFDLSASGNVTNAMNILYDKANKAMRALLNSIARFNIPVKTSLNLYHTFISPIILYNVENWSVFTDKKIENFHNSIFKNVSDSKVDILHRKFLKHIL